MRYLGTIGFFFALFLWVAIFAGPPSGAAIAQAAQAPQVAQAPLTGLPAPLTQQSGDTWTTTVYLGTAPLCEGAVSYDLVTTAPDSATIDKRPMYVVPGTDPRRTAEHPPCATSTKTADPEAEVILSFTPSPPLTAAPQTATLVVTPVGATAQGTAPLNLTLPVHRQVSAAKYLWIPLCCGLGLAVLLVLFTGLFGVPRPESGAGNGRRVPFWRVPLYASAAWSFSDSWATNITAVGTVVGTVLTASGSVSELLPGIELGRFSLLIALAGGITVAAPLLFGALNYHFASVDPTTAGVAEIWLPPGPDPDGVELAMSAGGSITVYGSTQLPAEPAAPGVTLNPGASLEVPAGSVITITGGGGQVLAVPGSSDVVVFAGKRIMVNARLTIPASDIANAAHQAEPRELPAGTGFDVPDGAKISFLGQATMTLPDQATVKAPVAKPASGRPWHDHRHTVVSGPQQFAIPNSGEVVAGKMWTMLVASCMTVFGIGAELGIVGWVLGYDLVVGPQWARNCSLALASAAAALVLCYGVSAICALADSREGTALSGARNSSFML